MKVDDFIYVMKKLKTKGWCSSMDFVIEVLEKEVQLQLSKVTDEFLTGYTEIKDCPSMSNVVNLKIAIGKLSKN